VAILLQSFSKVVIVLNYELNKDYIAQNLCVNRAQVEKKCQGKCHLAKKMKEDEQREKAPVNPIKEKAEITVYTTENSRTLFTPSITDITHYTPFLFPAYTAFYPMVFHPPSFLA
jgi:hypothetical protein